MTFRATPDPVSPFADLIQTDPGLAVLRMAALSAEPGGALDDETLDILFERVEAGVLSRCEPAALWRELERGLMAPVPSAMIRGLRDCGALFVVLPEVAALFGVPQIADDPPQVDIGHHLLRALDEAARRGAPPSVRFALLVMNVGKADSPPEHLPVHYRHVERGRPRIQAMAERFRVAGDALDLALLALAECERVHRVSEVRAGPVAAMLERLGAFDRPEMFQRLMMVCASDYCAYEGRKGADYPKAALLSRALEVCAGIDSGALAPDGGEIDLREARAEAIAAAFGSERWSSRVDGAAGA
jgi:tRNA nucleotidyltransferase (CCA-adding enzyme)